MAGLESRSLVENLAAPRHPGAAVRRRGSWLPQRPGRGGGTWRKCLGFRVWGELTRCTLAA